MGFELFQHTADLGIRVWANSKAELVSEAVKGLYGAIGEIEPEAQETEQMSEFTAEADSDAHLLRDFLAHVLFTLETRHRMVTSISVHYFEAPQIRLTVGTKLVAPDLSVYHREVKAITYHELALDQKDDGYELSMIVDI